MMEQKLMEAKKILNQKRRLYIGSLIISIFWIVDPIDIYNGCKFKILLIALAIVSGLNIITLFKERPEDSMWD